MTKPTRIGFVIGSKVNLLSTPVTILTKFPVDSGVVISGTAWIEIKAKSATDLFASRVEVKFVATRKALGEVVLDFNNSEVLARTNPSAFNVVTIVELVQVGSEAALSITPSFIGTPLAATAQVTLIEPAFAYHLF